MNERLSGQLALELEHAAQAPRTGKTAAERGWGPEDFLERHAAGFVEHHHSGPGIPAHERWELVCPECDRGMTRLSQCEYYCQPCDLLATADDILWRDPDELPPSPASAQPAGGS